MGLFGRLLDRCKQLYVTVRSDTRNSTLEMGRGSRLNVGCVVRGPVRIGNYCAIGRHVTFQGRNHEYGKPAVQVRLYRNLLESELGFDAAGITVGSDVWIGSRSILLPGVTVGHGAIVGAGAVVTRDVEPYAIVGGVPAERIGWRFPEHVREQLLDVAWWEWSEDRIARNREFFQRRLEDVDEDEQLSATVE